MNKICTRCKADKDESEFRVRVERRKNRGGPFEYLNNTCRQCDTELANKYYFRHKDDPGFLEKWRKKSTDYHHRNREVCLKKLKSYRERDDSKRNRKEYERKNRKQITSKHAASAKKWSRHQIENITDVYCIALIRSQNGGKKKCPVITQAMIEEKRMAIKIKRKLYEVRKTNTRGNHARVDSLFQGTSINRSF